MATIGAASPGDSGSDADDAYDPAITHATLLRGTTFIKISLLREIKDLSRQLESKMAQQQRVGILPEAEAKLQAEIKKMATQLEDFKLSSMTILSELKVVADACGDDVLSGQVASLLNALDQDLCAGKTFDIAALGLIPGLPSLDKVPAGDNGQPGAVLTKSTTLPAAVPEKSPSDSAADTLFDDLYDEPDEKPSNPSSNIDGGYETEHHFSSDDDSVVFIVEAANKLDAVGSFKFTPSSSAEVNDTVSFLSRGSFHFLT